jgi:hypothetical protein
MPPVTTPLAADLVAPTRIADPDRARPAAAFVAGYAAAGFLAGALFGAALRLWMRFIATDPEFTWSGTLIIVGAFAVLGTNVGVVTAGRQRGWRSALMVSRVVGIVLGMLCFGGAGVAMLPMIVPAGLAVGRRDWRRWIRIGLAVLGALVAAAVALSLPDLSLGRRAAALAILVPLAAVEAAAFGALYAPTAARGTVGKVGRIGAVAPAIGLGLVVILTAIGI